ncbi:hypothetical protein [Corallococcus exercitus]|nr:hypothetical protein [Corallococcus exercitus]
MGLQVSDESSLQTPTASWALNVYGGVPPPASPVQLMPPPLEDTK